MDRVGVEAKPVGIGSELALRLVEGDKKRGILWNIAPPLEELCDGEVKKYQLRIVFPDPGRPRTWYARPETNPPCKIVSRPEIPEEVAESW